MKNPKCPKCNSSKNVILLLSLGSIQGVQPSSLASLCFRSILSKENKNNDTPYSQFKCKNCNESFNE